MLIRTCSQDAGRIGDEMEERQGGGGTRFRRADNKQDLSEPQPRDVKNHRRKRRPLSLGASLVWLAGNVCLAAQSPEGLSDFDRRHENLLPTRDLSAAKASAFAQFKAALPGARVDWDPLLETPKFIRAPHGLLAGRSGRPPRASAAGGSRTNRHEPVRQFLAQHSALFGHGSEALDAAQIKSEFVTSHNGLRTIVWEQRLDGIPVFQGMLVAHITAQGE